MFWNLLIRLIPLYLTIAIGYYAGKKHKVESEHFSTVLFYLIVPILIFDSIISVHIDLSILILPFLVFAIACLNCLLFYFIAKRFWNDATVNIIAFSAGTANTGFFGIPVASAIFDQQGVAIFIMIVTGVTLYENSLGFYIATKRKNQDSNGFIRIAKLPSLYAFVLGCIANFLSIKRPEALNEFSLNIKGCYVVLGMLIIGISLAKAKDSKLDLKFLGLTFLARFVAWPLFLGLIACLDYFVLHLYSPVVYGSFLILSILPLAVNLVVISNLVNTASEKASFAVLASAVFGIFYIPSIISLFF